MHEFGNTSHNPTILLHTTYFLHFFHSGNGFIVKSLIFLLFFCAFTFFFVPLHADETYSYYISR